MMVSWMMLPSRQATKLYFQNHRTSRYLYCNFIVQSCSTFLFTLKQLIGPIWVLHVFIFSTYLGTSVRLQYRHFCWNSWLTYSACKWQEWWDLANAFRFPFCTLAPLYSIDSFMRFDSPCPKRKAQRLDILADWDDKAGVVARFYISLSTR